MAGRSSTTNIRIRLAARISGGISAFLIAVFLVFDFFRTRQTGEGFMTVEESLAMRLFMLASIIAVIVAWRDEKIGGFLLVICYGAWSAGGYMITVTDRFLPALLFSPVLITGILFLLYRRKMDGWLEE